MPLRRAEKFIAEGSQVFKPAPVSRDAVRGWVAIAQGKAKDSGNQQVSMSTRLGAAYDCVLNLSLAVLNAGGWRCTSADGHHKESLEAACAIAGISTTAFDDMDAVRDIRNDQYRGRAPTQEDVALAVKTMNTIAPRLLEKLAPLLRD